MNEYNVLTQSKLKFSSSQLTHLSWIQWHLHIEESDIYCIQPPAEMD